MMNDQKYSIIFPGRIVEYFAATQTATIKISAEMLYSAADKLEGTKVKANLIDVPVHTPSGGGWAITMPIKAGDTCLLMFSQVGYDHWLFADKDEAGILSGLPQPHLKRKFSEDDGFAIVGLNTIPRAITSYTTDGSQWRNSDATQFIHLKEDLSIVIDSPTSITINAPSVTVNSPAVTVNSTDSIVNATGSATITTPAMTVDCPLTTFTGLIACTGIGAGAAPAAGKMSVTGTVDASGDIVSGGISLQGHTHNVLSADFGSTGPAL